MLHHRITRALAALVVAGALVSCAADAQPRGSGMREAHRTSAHPRADRKQGLRPAAGPVHTKHRTPHGPAGDSAAAGAGAASRESGPSGTTRPAATTAGPPASRPSCRDDSAGDPDSSGDAPSYADVTGGCLRAVGSQLRLEVTTLGPVPARAADGNTQLAYGFELTLPSGSSLYVHAQASPSGWATYLSRGHGRRQIGRPTINGSEAVLTLPLAELQGARHVEWALESSWLRSGLVATSYAFDSAPNIGTVPFDR